MFLASIIIQCTPNDIQLHYCIIHIQISDWHIMDSKAGNKEGYLQSQNRKLKEQIEDLKEVIQMNKIEIDVLSKNHSNQKLIEIISNYRNAQQNSQKKIELMEKKISDLVSQKLVLEQLNQEISTEQKAVEEFHRERLAELQQIIKDLQKKIVNYEKSIKNYDGITGFVQRNKEIFNPTEQAIQFLKRQDDLQQQISLMKFYLEDEKSKQQTLLNVNGILRHKVVTLQAKLAMPNKNLGEILDKSLKRLMMYFIQTQKRMLTGDESDSQGEQDVQLIAPELSTLFGEQKVRRQNTHNVPPIDLLRIRATQATGNQKIKEELIKRNHLTKEERIQRLEIELEYTRRELTKNIIDLREQLNKRKILEKICEQLQNRNYILTKSNEQYAERIEKYNAKIKEVKEKRKRDNTNTIEEGNVNDITLIRVDNNYVEPRQNIEPRNKMLSLAGADSLLEYKVHLQLLAKDLNRNEKIKNLKHLTKVKSKMSEQEWKPKIKRSTSNPFLYFDARRDEIMDVNTNEKMNEDRYRLEQTAIDHQHMQFNQGENLDDIDV